MAKPEISHSGTAVAVRAKTTLPLENETQQAGFNRRIAKIVWRSHLGRLDSVEVTVAGGGMSGWAAPKSWGRRELHDTFGARPDGLDDGRAPRPIKASNGPYHKVATDKYDKGAEVITALLARTASEYYRSPAVADLGQKYACYTGFFGDKPTGKHQLETTVKVTIGDAVQGEATLPGLADYWAALGLEVSVEGLDDGLNSFRATVPGVGGVSMNTYDPASQPGYANVVLLKGFTDCLS